MLRRALAIVALAGCGRIDFDPASSDAPGSGDDAAALVIPPGVGVWLKMDSGPAVIDSAGGHAASCAAACPVVVPGLHGNAYQFKTEEVQVQYGPDLDGSAGFTAAFWVRIDHIPPQQECPFSKPFNPAQGWDMFVFCIQADGTTLFDGESATGMVNGIPGPLLTLNTWHHLAWVWDGTTKKVYADGSMVGQRMISSGSSTDYFSVGAGHGTSFLDGSLDDVMFYPRALSAQEVTQLATP